ncbi:MAG: sugar phosphate isomerase/epimerase family protein [Candidatus Anstonellaceae archaeon]
MIIGAMNHPHKELIEEIYKIGEMNFDYLELTVEYPAATPEKIIQKKEKIKELIESYNLGLLTHLPWYFSIAHPYQRIQKAINKEIENAMQISAFLGAKSITLHPELVLPVSCQGRKKMIQNSLNTIKFLNKTASNFGMQLCLETVDEKALSLAEYKQILSEVDIKITLDIGHAQTYFSQNILDLIDEIKKHVGHVHLHDGKGGEDHLPLGAGRMDLKDIIKKLKEFYNSTITLEIHSADPYYLSYSKDRLEIEWYGKKEFEENKKYLKPEEK